jgi:hypothetical protein
LSLKDGKKKKQLLKQLEDLRRQIEVLSRKKTAAGNPNKFIL